MFVPDQKNAVMARIKRSTTLLLGVLLIAGLPLTTANGVSATEPTSMTGLYEAEFFDIESDAVDETFRIFVAKPVMMQPDQKYPVIYALDGNGTFGLATDMVRLMSFGQEIPNAYVVAIGYAVDSFAQTMAKRYRDYTPTRGGELETLTKAQFDPANAIQAGGGPAMLKFITDELKPIMESRYAIDPNDATIGGASLGGLFPAWILLTAPETFQRYIIVSPSIWWNNEEVWRWEEEAAKKHRDIDAKVFVTAGGLETAAEMKAMIRAGSQAEGPMAEMMKSFGANYDKYGWPKMAEITPKFAEKMRSRGYPNLKIHTHNLPDETHMSVPPGAWSRGLRYVFGHWSPK